MSKFTSNKSNFLKPDFKVTDWESIKVYFDILESRIIKTQEDFISWIIEISDLQASLEEEVGWRYIATTRNTDDHKAFESYDLFINEIYPKSAAAWHRVKRKMLEFPELEKIKDKGYGTYITRIQNEVELFAEKNISLETECVNLSQEYSALMGSLIVTVRDKDYTMEEAQVLLNSTDRDLRQDAFHAMHKLRFEHSEKVNNILSELIVKRCGMAWNLGFENFLEYQFKALNRVDYTVEDCQDLHQSIKTQILPILNEIYQRRKETFDLEALRPWDLNCDINGLEPLKPAADADALLGKAILCLDQVDPFFATCARKMMDMKHLDLASRPDKAPGGYNYPLHRTGVPFIFMNAAGSHADLIVLIHELGHAVHSFLSSDLEICSFKETSSEVAELASMSMELLSLDYWHLFYSTEEESRRAKIEHFERIFMLLPHIACIDRFQHWIYKHPEHNMDERKRKWQEILDEFGSTEVSWFGLDNYKSISWQAVLHIITVPLYFIEYAIAQLGAIAIWRNYKQNPSKTIEQFKEALALGSSVGIPEMYETAGIRFDFSESYIQELADFLYGEYKLVLDEES